MQSNTPDNVSYRLLIDVLSSKLRLGTIEESDEFTELVMELLYLEEQSNLELAQAKATKFDQV
jgi:hypothetical protein